MGSYKYCLCFTRKFRWSAAEPPADVKAAFDELSEGGLQIGPEQLRRFLADKQGETITTTAEAERIIEQIRQQRHRLLIGKVARPILSLEEFHHYLFSEELNPPVHSQVR